MQWLALHDENDPAATTEWFQKLVGEYPRHELYGIDYSSAVDCPIVTCIVHYDGHVLLAKRSPEVIEYPNCWALIGGFMAGPSPFIAALTELQEEAGIHLPNIAEVRIARWRMRLDPTMKQDVEFSGPWRRRWFEFRVTVELREKVVPVRNEENSDLQWFRAADVPMLDMLPSSQRTLMAWSRARNAMAAQ